MAGPRATKGPFAGMTKEEARAAYQQQKMAAAPQPQPAAPATAQPAPQPAEPAVSQEGLPWYDRAALGVFTKGEDSRRYLSKMYGGDQNVRQNAKGEFEVNVPDQGWTAANPSGFDVGDLWGMAGPALPAVGGIAGSLTATPAIGGVAGAVAGDTVRQGIGDLILGAAGTSSSAGVGDRLGQLGWEGALATGGAVAGKVFQGAKWLMSPTHRAAQKAAKEIAATPAGYAANAATVEEMGVPLTLAQKTGSNTLLEAEQVALNTPVGAAVRDRGMQQAMARKGMDTQKKTFLRTEQTPVEVKPGTITDLPRVRQTIVTDQGPGLEQAHLVDGLGDMPWRAAKYLGGGKQVMQTTLKKTTVPKYNSIQKELADQFINMSPGKVQMDSAFVSAQLPGHMRTGGHIAGGWIKNRTSKELAKISLDPDGLAKLQELASPRTGLQRATQLTQELSAFLADSYNPVAEK